MHYLLCKCNLCISFLISLRYFCCLNKLISPYQFHAYQNGRPGVKLTFGRFLQPWFGQLAQVSGLRAEEVIDIRAFRHYSASRNCPNVLGMPL